MPPRIANDCFPDEFLTVDYDTMGGMAGPIAPMPVGGTHNPDMNADQLQLDNDVGGAAEAAAAVAMADAELDATAIAAAGTATQGGDNNDPNAIENDPLSMGPNPNNNTNIGHTSSHSSSYSQDHNHVVANNNMMNDNANSIAGNTTVHTANTMGTMGSTITVNMAAAAQQAWDQFVAGQEAQQVVQAQQQQQLQQEQTQYPHQEQAVQDQQAVPMAMEGITDGGYSPSSISQAASPSTTSLGVQHYRGSPPAPSNHLPNSNDTTPTTYQQLLLEQHRQDILNAGTPSLGHANNDDPTSVHSAPAEQAQPRSRRVSSITGTGHAVPGRPVPRASSFGGFPTPPRANIIAQGLAPLAPAMEDLIEELVSDNAAAANMTPMPMATVSRSNSVASSLTASLASGVHNSANSNSSTYHRFLSSFLGNQATSPLETIEPSDAEDGSPQETYGSIHSSSAFSSPATAANAGALSPDGDSKMSPGEHSASSDGMSSHSGNSHASFSHSPKLPYSPSLLDQTSFPEEESLSIDVEEDVVDDLENDKYSPISKLDWNENADQGQGQEGGKESGAAHKGMDTTADTTMLSQDVSSHVIHEDSTLVTEALTPSTNSTLRPRPSPFARANSTSSGVSPNSNNSTSHTNGVPTTVGGAHPSSSQTAPPQPRGMLTRNEAFELSPTQRPQYRHQISDVSIASNDGSVQLHVTPPPLSFGTETTISDLTYYAEKGCIVDVLAALTNPHLKTLGSRMLADYAKMPHRRVAVASNTMILEFVQATALEIGSASSSCSRRKIMPFNYSPPSFDQVSKYTSPTWLGREYAVETVRSLTAAEENDGYLMNAPGLLQMLALVARGGPFVQHVAPPAGQGYSNDGMVVAVPPPEFADNGTPGPRLTMDNTMGVASDKARLHACIAIMNLSCGKSNKVEITSVTEILEGMRDVMLGRHFTTRQTRGLLGGSSSKSNNVAQEARLKATTCIKNLSNADANDAALLSTPGLVETLGYVAEATCHAKTGATTCTTHACLALMNLSISKANKNRVFRTPGVMDALMAVITRTAPKANAEPSSNPKDPNFEARVKACSALSNLAIGYDNKIPMFNYPGFVESILTVIKTDKAEARTKACSILWSFAAEMKNQVPVVQRGDILPVLVSVAKEDTKTEARFKCVAALTLLAESPENAVPLLRAGSLEPLMNVLQEAGPDPTQWRGQTASWCVGFLMNMAQCDDVVPALLQEGIVDLLAPLLSLDHYQSLKAAMAVTFVCQYDTGDKTYNLLRQTENVIPKIVGLLHNTLSGRGGSGYKYGVFTLRSSVGCIASLAAGPDFMKERIATDPVFESLLKVVEDFCVDGGTPGAIVGGGKDDTRSVTLAVRALSSLIGHLIPEPNCAAMPFGPAMDDQLITALGSFETSSHEDIDYVTRKLAYSARIRVEGGKNLGGHRKDSVSSDSSPDDLSDDGGGIGLSLARKFFPFPCGMNLHIPSDPTPPAPALPPPPPKQEDTMDISDDAASATSGDGSAVRTFLLTDSKTGRRFAVPCDPSGGRQFNDNRVWCFRRGRFCNDGELPDSNFLWSDELQVAYNAALNGNVSDSSQG